MALTMKYFILKPKSRFTNDMHASASRAAMRAYAERIAPQDYELAEDLRAWATAESALAKFE